MVAVSLKKKFFQAEDGIRDKAESRGLGDVYKRQVVWRVISVARWLGGSVAALLGWVVRCSCRKIVDIVMSAEQFCVSGDILCVQGSVLCLESSSVCWEQFCVSREQFLSLIHI